MVITTFCGVSYNIFRFQIPVYDSFIVAMLNSQCRLFYDKSRLFFRERTKSTDIIVKIRIHQLQYNHQLLLAFEHIVYFDCVFTMKLL